ncbi:hypothetical protein E3Q19_03540 [Wallemia mellicola]|nr:hypothetical protein E3Q19_03540 [Wallemia mellicola]
MNRNSRRKARSLDLGVGFDDNDFKLHRSWHSRLSSFKYLPTNRYSITYATIGFLIFALSLTKFLMWYLNPDKNPLPWRTYCQDTLSFPHELADSLAPVTILVGVMSIDRSAERRNVIRQTYARKASPRDGTHVQVIFFIARSRPSLRHAIHLEQETFGDLVVLDMKENMNSGKTFEFFNWASKHAWIPDPATLPSHLISYPSAYNHQDTNAHERVFQQPNEDDFDVKLDNLRKEYQRGYQRDHHDINNDDPSQHISNYVPGTGVKYKRPDFVVKADDDSFIILGELERHLRILPKKLVYWGYLIKNRFMGGQAYALSFDLVEWIASNNFTRGHQIGAEDNLTARWMKHHPKANEINWVSERCWIYNHPRTHTVYSHGFLFPSEVTRVKEEAIPGSVSIDEQIRRGQGNRNHSEAYSTVFKWGKEYEEPRKHLSVVDRVAALVEGADESLNSEEKKHGVVGLPRQSLSERYEGRPWGGTIIVHFIKRHEWFYETALAFLTDWSLIPHSKPIASKNYWTKTNALHNKDDDFDRQRGYRLIDITDGADVYRFRTSLEPFPTN